MKLITKHLWCSVDHDIHSDIRYQISKEVCIEIWDKAFEYLFYILEDKIDHSLWGDLYQYMEDQIHENSRY